MVDARGCEATLRHMKRALIIGATGGIGSAVAAELETRGFEIVGRSRRDGLDVMDEASIAGVMGALSGEFDVIFIAIGTLAADGVPEKSLGAIEAAQMAKVFAINAIGSALILAQIERLLPVDRPATVGVLSARVGSIGDNKVGGWHSYRASKAALNQIVHGAAIEIGRKRKQATIVALHPGTVETKFTAGYPGHSKVSAQVAASNLCNVMMDLSADQTGQFFDYSGAVVAW